MANPNDWAQRFWRNMSNLSGYPAELPYWTQLARVNAVEGNPPTTRDIRAPLDTYLNAVYDFFSMLGRKPVGLYPEQPYPSSTVEARPAQIQLYDQDPSVRWYYEFTRQHGGVTPEVYYGGPAAQYDPDVAASALEQAVWDREWGEQFMRTYGRPPSDDDWKASYWHRMRRYLAGESPYGG